MLLSLSSQNTPYGRITKQDKMEVTEHEIGRHQKSRKILASFSVWVSSAIPH